MRVIVAGSRSISDYSVVWRAILASGLMGEITELVSGTAPGVDRLGESWAAKHQIPIRRFPADWTKYGKRAGYLRNELMAQHADALILVWDGASKGSRHMLDIARKRGIHVYLCRVT